MSSASEDQASRSGSDDLGGERRSRSARRPERRPARPSEQQKKPLPVWQETILLLGIALVLALIIKTFFIQAFYIPSGSMNDTLIRDDKIVVQKVSYWTGQPERGDIVVFADPGGWLSADEVQHADNMVTKGLEVLGLYPTGGHLVKRVIGVGGDTVKCCDAQGHLLVNGVPLHEKEYLAPGAKPSLIKFTVTVPEGHIWVMGDNRPSSADSRVHMGDPGGGFIPVDDVVGKVLATVWPPSRMTIFHRPQTFSDVPSD